MNKAQRLLTIYTRLLNNQGVNKMNLADELEVDERTIQRDIDDIRNYLFDNEEFQQRMEVTYQHKTNEYRLIRHNALLDSNILSILIMHLKNHSSVISRDMYELLKSIIYKFYSHDTKHLLEQINMFHVVDEEKNTLTVLSILQEAIHQQNTITIELKTPDDTYYVMPEEYEQAKGVLYTLNALDENGNEDCENVNSRCYYEKQQQKEQGDSNQPLGDVYTQEQLDSMHPSGDRTECVPTQMGETGCHYVTPEEYTKIMAELEAANKAIEEQQTP
ncbi:helix-turn-helix transcriptional regulator [Staphylococcus pseudintermedius]|uniref:helix-turn-helix transcriptional regulator n=1 Tax=Staphylococcus pseudintermedius TaxID=283734 RepID=UPI00101F6CFD|nr:HTH domain-containing protein [Staphylococcus pseudintermedius]RYS09592.1 hypothetical protein DLS52_04665 [Staphylococcus pseudintermedius]